MVYGPAVNAYRQDVGYEFNSGEIAAIVTTSRSLVTLTLGWIKLLAMYLSWEVTSEVLTNALDLDPRNQGRREGRRVADVLQSMGWRRLVTSRKDPLTGKSKSVRIWQRPKDDPLLESHELNDF